MPLPDATSTPPPYGLFGQPIKQDEQSGQFREKAPDGGYIIWQLKDVNGRQQWMIEKHVPAAKGTET